MYFRKTRDNLLALLLMVYFTSCMVRHACTQDNCSVGGFSSDEDNSSHVGQSKTDSALEGNKQKVWHTMSTHIK